MAKGGQFERDMCRTLSEWWVPGRDDIFWRSSNSGGRATVRSKKGKGTYGAYGDVAATDPIGKALLKLVTIELKCGYAKMQAQDIIDKPRSRARTILTGWVMQAKKSADLAKSVSWIIIHQRNHRVPMLYCYDKFFGTALPQRLPALRLHCDGSRLVGIPLARFLTWLSPDSVKTLVRLHYDGPR